MMKLSEHFYVGKSGIHGKGLFSKTEFESGSFLGTFDGPVAKRNGSHVLWIQKANGQWVGKRGFNMLRYLNHSSAPCAEFDGFDLFAIKPIRADEEITIDYGEEFHAD